MTIPSDVIGIVTLTDPSTGRVVVEDCAGLNVTEVAFVVSQDKVRIDPGVSCVPIDGDPVKLSINGGDTVVTSVAVDPTPTVETVNT